MYTDDDGFDSMLLERRVDFEIWSGWLENKVDAEHESLGRKDALENGDQIEDLRDADIFLVEEHGSQNTSGHELSRQWLGDVVE